MKLSDWYKQRKLELCLFHLFVEEIKYYNEYIYEYIKEDVYIKFVLERNTDIILYDEEKFVENNKFLSKLKEIEYDHYNFIGLCNGDNYSYRTQKFLTSTYNFTLINSNKYLNIINLEKINLTKLPDKIFCQCKCEKVILPKNLKKIPIDCFQLSHITSVKIPENCEIIETFAFKYCFWLKNIIIPKNVKNIKFKAFYKSNLESVTLNLEKKSILTIGKKAFHNTKLKKSTFKFVNKSVDVRYKKSKKDCIKWH